MADLSPSQSDIQTFITRWESSGAAERANYQIFLTELCDMLGVPRPDPTKPDEDENAYVFEKAVTFQHGDGSTSAGRIDLYRRTCFVLEAKQGSDREKKVEADAPVKVKRGRKGTAVRGTKGWDDAMLSARGQAEQYARALPASEGRPPFLIVVDVGYSIELYSEFSRSGGTYIPYPDPRSHRILLRDLKREEVRDTFRLVWTDPMALDPSRRSAKITLEVAARLALLAKSLEGSGYTPERSSAFLMRAIFTMFAEDVEMIPKGSFTELLEGLRGNVGIFPGMVGGLWAAMAEGGFSPIIRQKLLRFNGGLFESAEALPVTEEQLELLIEASKSDWKEVEPAIFGTLLERALDPGERHKLGAHYTPRSYVERLVLPAVIEPLREEWEAIQTAAVTQAKAGKLDEARAEVRSFHERLCQVRVLDPACGSGNFLYVTLELMKRLEGEVLRALEDFGELQHRLITVDPHQLLGIELNPRAAAIADLVLWIGYLQWYFRTAGNVMPQEPVLKKFHNVEHRDALLTGAGGNDQSSSTGKVEKAEWPEADFIVGNPPFLGKLHLLSTLGEEYVRALRKVYQGEVPDGADFVMFWWYRAARLAAEGKVKRFGFITTNSITQPFNRRIVSQARRRQPPIHLAFAIPDHPWVDSSTSAAVRISMTVGEAGSGPGVLSRITSEVPLEDGAHEVELQSAEGLIHANLRLGANVADAVSLKANSLISGTGLLLGSRGFVVTAQEAEVLRKDSPASASLIYPLTSGSDLTDDPPRNLFVIDPNGWTQDRLREQAPAVFQRLLERVYPERQTNRDPRLRENWWLFRRSNAKVRAATADLHRFIATTETAKHRVFAFLRGDEKPEHTVIAIALEDAFFLGVLSSKIHVIWALEAGGTLEDRPRYNKTLCFDPFPFPDCTEEKKARVRTLADQLDAHRKERQARHPELSITQMYNVLELFRSQERGSTHEEIVASLSGTEKAIYDQALVLTLKNYHDELDAAVFDAYGWPATLTEEEILDRLVDLNTKRAGEEREGRVRWLRPEFQNAAGTALQASLDTGEGEMIAPAVAKREKRPWPKSLAEQAKAVRSALIAQGGAVTPDQLAKAFQKGNADRVAELLETLASLGQARELEGDKYIA